MQWKSRLDFPFFLESCLLEGDLLTASLPAPVIVTEIEPPVEKEHAQLPPTTDVVDPREIPSQTEEEDRQTDGTGFS